MPVLTDTNLLLRSVQPTHPMNAIAVRAIETMLRRGDDPVVTVQNMAEFWNVATRPTSANGLGFSIEEAQQEVARLERYFQVISENAFSYSIWKALVVAYRVSGVQVHDARLVAVMKAYGIRRIVTFNPQDFTRFAEIEIIHPQQVE